MNDFVKMQLYKRRDIGDQITATFNFIKQNFKLLVISFFVFGFPFIFLGNFIGAVINFNNLSALQTSGNFLDNSNLRLTFFINYIGYALFTISVISLMKIYAEEDDPSIITFSMIKTEVFKKIIGYIGISILLLLIYLVSIMLFVLPFLYFAVSLSFVVYIYIIEDKEIGESMSGSLRLIKEYWWSTFGFYFLITIIVLIIVVTIVFPFTFFGVFIFSPEISGVSVYLNSFIYSLYQGLLSFIDVIIFTAVGIRYFTLKEIKEGISLNREIEAITEDEIEND
jgi:hypothetical protein